MKQIIHNLYFEFFIITYRPIIYMDFNSINIIHHFLYSIFYSQKPNNLLYI